MTCLFQPNWWDPRYNDVDGGINDWYDIETWYNIGVNGAKTDAELLVAEAKKTNSPVIIPDNWPFIPGGAFIGLEVKELVIPSNVKIIGPYAFHCAKIEKLTIAEGVEDIRNHAFSANKISDLSLPTTIENISSFAFADNKIISDIEFSPNLRKIGESSFYNNIISVVTLNEGIENTGEDAFKRNPVNGKDVVIPRSLEESGYIGWPENPQIFASEIIFDEEEYTTSKIDFHRLDAIFRDHIEHKGRRSTMKKTKRNSNVTVYKNFYPGTLYENGQQYFWNGDSEFQSLLLGTTKDDKIVGTLKSETFIGDTGSDEITGGDGADLFAFWHSYRKNDDNGNWYHYDFGKKNADRILDFNSKEGDHIGIPFGSFFGHNHEPWADSLSKILTLSYSNGKKEVKTNKIADADFVYDTKKGALYYNENGVKEGWGAGGMFAILVNSPPLNEDDFLILSH